LSYPLTCSIAFPFLHSFPTRRSSDLIDELSAFTATPGKGVTRLTYSQEDKQAREYIKAKISDYGLQVSEDGIGNIFGKLQAENKDRKSTRLNSSHVSISYAVFCLKKK